MGLLFADGSFDTVVCQFDAIFFPDKAAGVAKARWVLRPGGTFLFNVWDQIDDNEFASCVTQSMAGLFPSDPRRFLARVAHGYCDQKAIVTALYVAASLERMSLRPSLTRDRPNRLGFSGLHIARGLPLRNGIEARDVSILSDATDVAAAAIGQRFGVGQVTGKIQAIVIAATWNS